MDWSSGQGLIWGPYSAAAPPLHQRLLLMPIPSTRICPPRRTAAVTTPWRRWTPRRSSRLSGAEALQSRCTSCTARCTSPRPSSCMTWPTSSPPFWKGSLVMTKMTTRRMVVAPRGARKSRSTRARLCGGCAALVVRRGQARQRHQIAGASSSSATPSPPCSRSMRRLPSCSSEQALLLLLLLLLMLSLMLLRLGLRLQFRASSSPTCCARWCASSFGTASFCRGRSTSCRRSAS
mmetsp:Transcript_857/g.3136  ORF Transcript_857/g.3136 Transcript_857/m.3136 type:complete len:235 (+) Transcript_857:4334-5038(+)